jgi:hypothetical protein
MNRSRLGQRPKSNVRSRVSEYLIALGCLAIVSTLSWRAFGDRIAELTRPKHGQVVVLDGQDDCLGGLCTAPAGK